MKAFSLRGVKMIRCQSCGQLNSNGSNFCRFCGLNFTRTQRQEMPKKRVSYEYAPPKPYSWKTDELTLKEEKQTRPINQVRPLVNTPSKPTQKDMQMPQSNLPASYQQNMTSAGYRCPRCASQLMPKIEKKISAAGWIVFTVLLLTFFPLFWVGFLIKEEVKTCPVCNFRVA